MFDHISISNLRDAVIARDFYSVRYLLDNEENPHVCLENGENLLHLLIKISARSRLQNLATATWQEVEKKLVYMLCDAGVNVNSLNHLQESPLQCAVQCSLPHLCFVLLQCGADMHAITENGLSILEIVQQLSHDSTECLDIKTILRIFQKFQPGLCKAVMTSSIAEVRKLTNLWCKTDLEQNEKTLRELAIETGHEEIIDLILGVHSTMKLVHHVLANNTKAACKILDSAHDKLQLNIRNMSDSGAPILFYAIQDHSAKLVEKFIEKGTRVYTMMWDDENRDLPVLFTAIKPDIPIEVIEALLPMDKPQQEEMLYRLLYKGQNVLEFAVESHVPVEVFSVLIDRGGPMLLACRNKLNQTIEDVVSLTKSVAYKNVINEKTRLWLTEPENFPNRREILALWGYEWKRQNDETIYYNQGCERFLNQLSLYQKQIVDLKCAVEDGDVETFLEISTWTEDPHLFKPNLAWSSRPEFHRTALHYAYGIQDAEEIRNILLINGCSEHTLDKNGCEPLDFKIKQGTEEMETLLAETKANISNPCERDWWSECKWNTREFHDASLGEEDNGHRNDTSKMVPGNLQCEIRCTVL